MGPVTSSGSTIQRHATWYRPFTGPMLVVFLLFVAGADCWKWDSVSSCPPGPEPVCPENPADDVSNYFPHPTDCHYYIQCDSSRRPICRRCSPTTYFSPINFNCVWPAQASCEHNDTTRPESLLPPICVPDRVCNEEGETVRDYVDCTRYYVCHNGSKIRMECPEGQAFNDRLRKCDDPENAGCDNSTYLETRRCEVEGRTIKVDCSTYTLCKHGKIETERCNAGQYFDETTGECESGSCEKFCEDKEDPSDCRYYFKNCDQRTKCPENKHFNKKTKHCENQCTAGCQDPKKIPQCRECPQESQILQYDCHSYTICTGGKIVPKTCRADQYFDVTTGTCKVGTCKPPPPSCEDQEDPHDCNYYIRNCTERIKCPEGQHFNKHSKRCENQCTAGCQDPKKIHQCRECPQEGQILQYDCHSYTICTGGKIVPKTCRADQYFDVTTGNCKFGTCNPPPPSCEDQEDPHDCNYYIRKCTERIKCPEGQHFNKHSKRCENQCTAGCQDPKKIPQCRECPQEGQILQYDCHSYTICTGGKIVPKTCRADQYFDVKTGTCKFGTCNPPPPSCEDQEDPHDCNYYVRNCKERIKCPEGQHFNKHSKRCENQCTAGCQEPREIPQCRECPQEGQILQYDCHSYTICTGGKIVPKTCRADQYFDVTTGTCKVGTCNPPPPSCEDQEDPHDCNYYVRNCKERIKCPEGQHFNKHSKRCENQCTAGCQDPKEIPQCRECPQEGQILQYDCHSYTICTGGKIVPKTCRADQYFDVTTGTCKFGTCNPPPPSCEDQEDPHDCNYYIRNCTERIKCHEGQHFNKHSKRCENQCTAGCQDPNKIPQCRECPQEGQILQYDCHSYTICTGGKIVPKTCRADQYFDVTTGTCKVGTCNPPPPSCEDQEDPHDCNYYIRNCTERIKCPEGQHFNKHSKRCENQCTAGCQDPKEIPQCRECPQEGQILQYDCHSYTICTGGKIVPKTCRADQYFDVTTGTCKFGTCNPPPPSCEDQEDPHDCNYYVRNCKERIKCPEGQHFNKHSKRCENQCTAGCQNPKKIPQCRECPQEGQILQYDCHSYTICTGGKIVPKTCRADQYFDVTTGTCKVGTCNPPPPSCEDQEDPHDCNYYVRNCKERIKCPEGQHFNKHSKRCENQCTAGCQDPKEIPQCRECPREGQILQYDCHSYTICTGGKIVPKTCRADQYFNVTTGTCKFGTCNPPPPSCEDQEDPHDCNYYIRNCTERIKCPEGQHFNKHSKRCENQCTAGCQDPKEIPQCRECPLEGQILQYDCHSYTICTGGKIVPKTCRADQYFDVTTGTCKFGTCNPPPPSCEDQEDPRDCNYYIRNCTERIKCHEGQHFNKHSKRCENQCTAGCQDPNKIPQCRECPQEGQILQYDCHSYTICTGGKIVPKTCRADQYFDVTTGTCKVGTCNPPPPSCEDQEDPIDCNYYIRNCKERIKCPEGQHFNKHSKRCENQCTAGCQDPKKIPQCRECPQEGQILQYDCHSYTICTGGKIVPKTCRADQYFDVTTGTCKVGTCNPPPPSCEDQEDPHDCNYYVRNCKERIKCPEGQHFNKHSKRCENQCTAGCQDPKEIPQCRECPQEGQILQYDCHSYTICTGGKIVPKTCRADQYFDVTTGTCKFGTCNPPPPSCEDQEDPHDCNYYIRNCKERIKCPEGQHFNKHSKRCENQCTAGCQDPNKIPQCRECPQEGQILQYDCHSYTICTGGKIVPKTCKADQYFDVTTGTCKFGTCNPPPPSCEDQEDPHDCNYYIINCKERIKCPEGQHFNKHSKRCENQCTAGCQHPKEIPQCRECPQEGQILQYDCHSYTICTGGKIVPKTCRADQYFDVTTGTCKFGTCNPPPPSCEDQEDPHNCNYYIRNCTERIKCPEGQHFNKHSKRCENQCTAGCQDPNKIPQCRECPQEGQILQYDCHSYIMCIEGKITPVMCRSDQHFNLTSAKCEIGSCDSSRCDDTEDPSDCNYYFTNCNERIKCPAGQHFNKNTRSCENQCTAGCLDPSNISDCHVCEPEGKTFENPCSCEMYYKCVGGLRVLAMCDDGLHYNKTLGRCDAPCSDTCPKLFARKPECCASTKGKPQPLCPSTPYPVFLPHPSDSRWFYQCLQGVLYCNRCPPGHKWNIDEDTCDKSCQCP